MISYKTIRRLREQSLFNRYMILRERYLRRFPGEGNESRFTYKFNKKYCRKS